MIREEFRGENWTFPFVLYRPTEMKENLPMVVQLHGAAEVGYGREDLYKVDVAGFSHLLTEEADYPCIFVLPQCEVDSFWVAEIANLYCFIQSVKQEFHVDDNRVYLTGVSMGGYGTWYMALRHPELFAAIAPVCGGGMVWRAYVLDMAIWAVHGTEDEVVYPAESIQMIHKVRMSDTNKQEVKLTLLDGVGHNAHDYAYTQEMLNWLLSKRKTVYDER